METLELFCGTKSFSKVMAEEGESTFTVDIDPSFNPDLCINILKFKTDRHFDFIWASPPCTAFSVASIGSNWMGGHRAYIPKTESARLGIKLLDKTIQIISKQNPKYWCIENPRGVMRKIIEPIFKKYNVDFKRITVMYCQYGDKRMKPTDIWTNITNWEGKRCKNRNLDHESAPRGAKTGTQGLKTAKDRSVIPSALFKEILESVYV